MEFGRINAVGAGIVILMLIPNVVYAIRNKDEKNLCRLPPFRDRPEPADPRKKLNLRLLNRSLPRPARGGFS